MRSPASSLAPLIGFALLTGSARAQSSCVWESRTPVPVGRFEAATAVVDGKLYAMGGFGMSLDSLSRVDIYDPALDQWSPGADLQSEYNHAGVAVDGTDIWTAGGFDGDHPGVSMKAVWKYDTVAGQWSSGPDLPELRAAGALVRLGRDLHYFGGVLPDRTTVVSEHWVLDIDNQGAGWAVAAPLPVPRCHLAGIEFGGVIYALGGADDHDDNPIDLADVHAYDASSDSWSPRAPLPFPRSHFEPGTFVSNGRIVLAGGRSTPLNLSDSPAVTAYDPATDEWSALPPLPDSLLAPSVVAIGNTIYAGMGGDGIDPQEAFYSRSAATLTGGVTLRINAGGGAYVAGASQTWCADFGALGGESFTNAQIPDISGTFEDGLFTTERQADIANPGTLAYEFPLENGNYRVLLHFAEIVFGVPGGMPGGAGDRVFDIWLEGQRMVDDYDTAARVGVATADLVVLDIALTDNVLDVDLLASTGRSKINAIELIPLGDGAFRAYCPSLPNSSGTGAQLGFIGATSITTNSFTLRAADAPANVSGLFFHGPVQSSSPFGDGVRCVGDPLQRIQPFAFTDGAGIATKAFDFSAPFANTIAAGVTSNFQYWFRDVAGPGGSGFNLSSGYEVRFTP